MWHAAASSCMMWLGMARMALTTDKLGTMHHASTSNAESFHAAPAPLPGSSFAPTSILDDATWQSNFVPRQNQDVQPGKH